MERRRARDKQVRKLAYLSPPAMVAAVTARRLAGDWRGACAAGRIDAQIDLRDVASRYGAEETARIEADLLGFAPDLLRRFLPRTDKLALAPRARVVLSRLDMLPSGHAIPVLVATLPHHDQARQRIALHVMAANKLPARWHDLPDWCWHADAAHTRRWAYGASAIRLAWHGPDGRPYPQGAATEVTQPADRANKVETINGLLVADRLIEAYAAAGLTVETRKKKKQYVDPTWLKARLTDHGATLPVLASETRRLARRYGITSLQCADGMLTIDVAGEGWLTVRVPEWGGRFSGPIAFGVPAPVDVALLRWGSLQVDDLHPLVHEALFPQRSQTWRVPDPPTHPPIRVRCGPDWHIVQVIGGRLDTPRHSEEELRRELLLAGLDGPIDGCAAAVRAWRTGSKPVPKEIGKIRRDLLARVFHGDTDTVLALLWEGFDPELRDAGGGSLMHWLAHLDHTQMLPFLTAAGFSVSERDRDGATPLHTAASSAATEVMAALVAAGADQDALDGQGRTAAEVLAEEVRKAALR